VTTDLSLGSQNPMPPMTAAELIGRVALIHAAIDEYEMNATMEYAMRKRAQERDPRG
jgi:hypothetical protein